ncbi:MAG: SRPBCC family protein [Dehalococcoidia bacterium]
MKIIGMVAAVGALTATVIAYVKFERHRVLNWGAAEDEVRAVLPGDDLLDDVALQTTRAVTVNVPPEAIWPWLVQMGPKPRAGVYTYDWVERMLGIDIQNSDRILPEFQHLDAGEFFPLSAGTENGLTVRVVEERHALVLQWKPARSTWAFVLIPRDDGTTRLISRNRIPGSGLRFWLGAVFAMEPGSLVMERKMLLGIKRRAESLAAPSGPAPARPSGTGPTAGLTGAR